MGWRYRIIFLNQVSRKTVDHRQRKLVVCPSDPKVLAIFIQTKRIRWNWWCTEIPVTNQWGRLRSMEIQCFKTCVNVRRTKILYAELFVVASFSPPMYLQIPPFLYSLPVPGHISIQVIWKKSAFSMSQQEQLLILLRKNPASTTSRTPCLFLKCIKN